MAISAASVWEVRPTVGSDTNGGGFVAGASGTDFSQQNAANSGGNNSSTTDGVGVGTTTWVSATASFTAAIVGNLIFLSGTGITTGWYQVVTFTNGTTVVLDRSPGTGTGVTMNIGGALATIAAAFGPLAAGNTIYVQASGTYTVTSALSVAIVVGIAVIGYTATRGDNGRVSWTTSTNSTNLIACNGSVSNGVMFENFAFSNTAAVRSISVNVTTQGYGGWMFSNCLFDGFTTAIQADWNITWQFLALALIGCEIKNCSDKGINSSGPTLIQYCYIHACTTAGLFVETPQQQPCYSIDRSVFAGNGIGVQFANDQNTTVNVSNSSFYSNTTAGIAVTGGSGAWRIQSIVNNIFWGNGTYGIDFSANFGSPIAAFVQANAFGNNTSGARNGYPYGAASDITLTGDPFTNASADDFTLNSTAGAGLSCQGAGYQGALNGA